MDVVDGYAFSQEEHGIMSQVVLVKYNLLWLPCVADADITFLSCGFFFLSFSSPNLSRHRLDVYHTSTHGVALV